MWEPYYRQILSSHYISPPVMELRLCVVTSTVVAFGRSLRAMECGSLLGDSGFSVHVNPLSPEEDWWHYVVL